MPTHLTDISAVILAGGKGSRLNNQDKGLIELNKTPLVQHLINRLLPQVNDIVISANRNLNIYAHLGFPVYEDDIQDFAGPLAGILKALQNCKSEWLLTVPADSPFIPKDLVLRLSKHMSNNKIIIAHDGKHLQPTFSLLHSSLVPSLDLFLQNGKRKTREWMQQQSHDTVDFSDQPNAFININTADELQYAEEHFEAFMS